MQGKYYQSKLYPFQNEVLHLIQEINLSFYLTGGTALSRCYLNHRYSDDLDFFVNANSDFKKESTLIINRLKESSRWVVKIGTVSDSFIRLVLEKKKIFLKIDFVNDVKYHKGAFQKNVLFHQIDNWCNILSNKLCALSRMDVKDIVDILFIAKKYEFKWSEIFQDAKEKDLWVEPIETCKILKGFPKELLNSVKWISPVDVEMLNDDITSLHNDIFLGHKNSLCLE